MFLYSTVSTLNPMVGIVVTTIQDGMDQIGRKWSDAELSVIQCHCLNHKRISDKLILLTFSQLQFVKNGGLTVELLQKRARISVKM